MPLTRIYVPLTAAGLRQLADTGRIDGPVAAHAVTPALERAHPADRLEEELEFVALTEAAAAARARAGGTRRVIGAADVDSAAVTARPGGDGGPPGAVEVAEPVPVRRFASFHVDETAGGDDEDLLWYDVTELDEVRRLAGS